MYLNSTVRLMVVLQALAQSTYSSATLPSVHSTANLPSVTLSQYDQIRAEVNGSLSISLLHQWMVDTNANTFSFLLWDTDGHQYRDMVRFLNASQNFKVNGQAIKVWCTLIPPSETEPVGPPPPPPPGGCIKCPVSHPFLYGCGGPCGGAGGFCCPVPSIDGEHCPGSGECCLTPRPGEGCEDVKRCGINPTNRTVCPPSPSTHSSNRVDTSVDNIYPAGAQKCSVPADSPITPFNESSLIDSSKGWKGCNDYTGWGKILGLLAKQFPQLVALNIDDFSSNVPHVFNNETVASIRTGLAGRVKLIPTHYYVTTEGQGRFVFDVYPWLASATDGVLFYFRNDKEGQQECGNPSSADGGLCTPPGEVGYEFASTRHVNGPTPCTSCCLSGSRAEISLKNIASEIDDFANALPTSHPLHIGLYFSAYSHCVPPSPTYDREALLAALAHPKVTGATVYITQVPQLPCQGSALDTDKGCIVQAIFKNHSSL